MEQNLKQNIGRSANKFIHFYCPWWEMHEKNINKYKWLDCWLNFSSLLLQKLIARKVLSDLISGDGVKPEQVSRTCRSYTQETLKLGRNSSVFHTLLAQIPELGVHSPGARERHEDTDMLIPKYCPYLLCESKVAGKTCSMLKKSNTTETEETLTASVIWGNH